MIHRKALTLHYEIDTIRILSYKSSHYTKTDLVFGFLKNQILVAVIPGQKVPRTLLGQNSFQFFSKTIL